MLIKTCLWELKVDFNIVNSKSIGTFSVDRFFERMNLKSPSFSIPIDHLSFSFFPINEASYNISTYTKHLDYSNYLQS